VNSRLTYLRMGGVIAVILSLFLKFSPLGHAWLAHASDDIPLTLYALAFGLWMLAEAVERQTAAVQNRPRGVALAVGTMALSFGIVIGVLNVLHVRLPGTLSQSVWLAMTGAAGVVIWSIFVGSIRAKPQPRPHTTVLDDH
jgi:hypothetical protein